MSADNIHWTSDFEKEALAHFDALRNSALKMAKSEPEADDLVQETFLRAFRSFHRYANGTNCRAWLFRIMTNIFINRYNRRKISPEVISYDQFTQYRNVALAQEGEKPALDAEAIFSELLDDDIKRLLRELPYEFRLVIILCDIQGFSYADIARITHVKIGTVKSRLSRARRKLEKGLMQWAKANSYILAPKSA